MTRETIVLLAFGLLAFISQWLKPLESLIVNIAGAGAPKDSIILLLSLPVGVTLVIFLRLLVGIDSFGIFYPLLLALAFQRTGILFGLTVFGTTLLLFVPLRLFLDKLALLNIARTGVIVSVTTIVFLAAWSFKIGSTDGGFANLGLPLFLLAGIIDRFVSAQIDQSLKEAIKLSIHTIIASVALCFLLSWSVLGNFIHLYPDTVFFFPLLILFMGRYTGLRLTELWRFRKID